jgi:ubiquinone/menaquinone biosynthesis C-methylase UbiE
MPTATPETSSVSCSYDEAALWYDAWGWQTFWDRNEIPLVVAACARFAGARRALDAGAGTGRYVATLGAAGLIPTGVDISRGMLAVAAAKLGADVRLVHADIRSLPFEAASFDLAVAARVLGHVADVEVALADIARTVVVGGGLIVTELDWDHAFEQTTIPTPRGSIPVAIQKRDAQSLTRIAERVGWRLVDGARIRATNCRWLPPSDQLTSIDRSGARAIFYVLTFVRA